MKMKRIFALLLLVLLCLTVGGAVAEVTTGYCGDRDVNHGQNVTWSYDSTTQTMTISGEGAIAERVFYGSGIWNNAKALIIEKGITSIGKYAFASTPYNTSIGLYNIESVAIPDTVTSIGEAAFLSCGNLKSVTIPDSVESIGKSAFNGCTALTSIELPSKAISIGAHAFAGCDSLTDFKIPDSITHISENMFGFSDKLVSITIPASVISVGDGAFQECPALNEANVPCSWDENPLYDFGADVTVNIAEHGGDSWVEIKPATHTETGIEQRACEACGAILETREIPKLPVLPQTGDDSRIALWLMLMGASAVCLTVMLKRKEA